MWYSHLEFEELWVQDLSAVSENILLAAHAMGLGACWTTIYPIISNLLKGKMRTIQKAYQPTMEFYTIVHSTFFVYKSSSERRIEKELKESHNLTILYNIHFTVVFETYVSETTVSNAKII